MTVSVRFGTPGRFVNSKRELSIDLVHEQLISTIYEQSISPVDNTMAEDLIAQWRVADPVAFYTCRETIIFGISDSVKLVTLYCHAIFWETEGFGEGCVKIMQIVSCLELMTTCLFLFIMVEFKSYYTATT